MYYNRKFFFSANHQRAASRIGADIGNGGELRHPVAGQYIVLVLTYSF